MQVRISRQFETDQMLVGTSQMQNFFVSRSFDEERIPIYPLNRPKTVLESQIRVLLSF